MKFIIKEYVFLLFALFCSFFLNSCSFIYTNYPKDNLSSTVLTTNGNRGFHSVFIFEHNTGKSAQGLWIKGRDSCVIVSAAHPFVDNSYVELFFEGNRKAQARVLDINEQTDTAVIGDLKSEGVLPDCSPVSYTNISNVVTPTAISVIKSVTRSGKAFFDQVRIRSREEKFLIISEYPGEDLRSGLSGAPLMIENIPVGILLSKINEDESSKWRIARLEYIMALHPRYLKFEPKKIAYTKPFDLSILPSDIQRVVYEARITERRASQHAQDAYKIKADAIIIKEQAEQILEGAIKNSISRYKTTNNDNYYWGQVKRGGIDNSLINSHGLGVSEVVQGDSLGNKTYCRFSGDNNNCNGLGVIEYGDNVNNPSELESWAGEFRNGNRYGYGIVKWMPTKKLMLAYINNRQNEYPLPGVYLMSDGSRYEGEISINWDGLGVLWNADGSIRTLGRWKNGDLIESFQVETQH